MSLAPLALLRAMRPHQWVKNLFVLAPLVFSRSLFELGANAHALYAFGFFCAASSAIYLVNDVVDAEADRAHPKKRARPIASGALSPRLAILASLVLGVGSLVGSALLISPSVAGVITGYFALNFAYSAGLKRVPYVDVLSIALGFELRVMAGALAAEVPASIYLLLATFFLASFLGLGKRLHELTQAGGEGKQRAVLARYDARVVEKLFIGFGVAPIFVYAAYVLDPETREVFGSPFLPLTTVFAVVGVARFIRIVQKERDAESPTEAMLRDPLFVLNFGAWAGAIVWMLYLG